MKIQEVKVEAVDKKTGFVLKRIKTDTGEFFNRKLAVSNTIYVCERARAKLDKPLIETPFQTHHLKWNNNDEEWELKGLKKERRHAEENNSKIVFRVSGSYTQHLKESFCRYV